MASDGDTLELLKGLARRLRTDPAYMAHVLDRYQKQEGIDDEGLAHRLGALPEMVVRLALCKRPEGGSPSFAEQVRELSDFTLIDEMALTSLIHKADGIVDLPGASTPHRGVVEAPSRRGGLAGLVSAIRAGVIPFRRWQATTYVSAALVILLLAAVWWTYSNRGSLDVTRSGPVSGGSGPPEPAKGATSGVEANPTDRVGSGAPSKETIASEKQRAGRSVTRADPVTTVRLDLNDHAVLRGEGGEQSPGKAIRLAPLRTRFELTLPEGGTEGTYDVSIVDPYGSSLIKTRASSPDARTLAFTLDLRRLSGDGYRLCISRDGEAPHYYSVTVGGKQ